MKVLFVYYVPSGGRDIKQTAMPCTATSRNRGALPVL